MSTPELTTASEILNQLQADVQLAWLQNQTPIADRWLETPAGRCRVAVADSEYGLHYEIGPLRGSAPKSTQVFSQAQRSSAVALLAAYLRPLREP